MKKNMVMRILFLVGALYASASALTKVDSILDVTGGLQMRMIWIHWQVCNANYSPVASSDQARSLQLMGFDTKTGKEFLIDSVKGSVKCYVRISWDGKYAIWSDGNSNRLLIRDFECKTPIKELSVNGYWYIEGLGYDSATSTTWIYASDNGIIPKLARFPLNANGTSVDLTKLQVFPQYINGDGASVQPSADGKYFAGGDNGTREDQGGIAIVDVANNFKWLARHDSRDGFGCQPGLTPDNTYRFMYLTDNHRMVRMFEPNLGTTSREVVIGGFVNNVSILPFTTKDHDVIVPRWTNNSRFIAAAYPLTSGFISPGSAPSTFGMTADKIKTEDPSNMPRCIIGRFDAAFTKVEKYALVSSGDIRSMDFLADAWIGPSQVAIKNSVSTNVNSLQKKPELVLKENRITVSFPYSEYGLVTIVDFQGRTVVTRSGYGIVVCKIGALAKGSYIVQSVSRSGQYTKGIIVSK